METTFMTIHNLTPAANILFASESIVDVLGWAPFEVIGQSCFEYFRPDEVPLAKYQHDRSIHLDRASVLYYSRIRARDGGWVSCECVFSVVYDVLVACTSVYRQGLNSERRALEAPQIRRIFASSPRDPRYHMLEYLSSKFRVAPSPTIREPRAALIINRFSRELPIMFATNAVVDILGVTAQEITSKSFYECIAENCLPDAIRSLESAKANDSIAYLRFMYRDPRRAEDLELFEREDSHSSDSEDGGVPIDVSIGMAHSRPPNTIQQSRSGNRETDEVMHLQSPDSGSMASRTDSGRSTDHEELFDHVTVRASPVRAHGGARRTPVRRTPPLELEAVVSCTSDGLVIILRRARPSINSIPVFAAPWGVNAIIPRYDHDQYAAPVQNNAPAAAADFMAAIREVAVFAWSLTGINGNIASYSHGIPRGEAVPPTGFPIWDQHMKGGEMMEFSPANQARQKWDDWERDGRVGSGGYERIEGWREAGGIWVGGNEYFHGNDDMDVTTEQNRMNEYRRMRELGLDQDVPFQHAREGDSLPQQQQQEGFGVAALGHADGNGYAANQNQLAYQHYAQMNPTQGHVQAEAHSPTHHVNLGYNEGQTQQDDEDGRSMGVNDGNGGQG